MSSTIVVIYSGGMDSYTVLHKALRRKLNVHALSFDYGQRHSKELMYAEKVCQTANVPHKIVDIRSVNSLLQGSSLTSDIAVPVDGYRADDDTLNTVVPNRNMIMLSLAVGYAVSIDASEVHYGPHKDDTTVYPDCRPEFVEKMDQVTAIANWKPVRIIAPLLQYSKEQILAEGLKMGLNYGETWTCYNGREQACGRCGACISRLKSFAALKITDPLEYEQ